ncbi:hypothetical protein HYZ99_05420 [Candidatus Peregrinibacteria bacterium]|nr:hypothetical protein [Candidatus Peregrinibacteria bacterium]
MPPPDKTPPEAPNITPARPSVAPQEQRKPPAEAERERVEADARRQREKVEKKTQAQQLSNIENRMNGTAAGTALKAGVEATASTVAGPTAGLVVGTLDRFTGMFETFITKLSYFQNQLSYYLAPIVNQLKKIKIPFFKESIESYVSMAAGFLGMDTLMLCSALKNAGLQPLFNPADPSIDSAAIEKLTGYAKQAKAKRPGYESQDFYNDLVAEFIKNQSGRTNLIVEELVPLADTMVNGMKQEAPKPQPKAPATAGQNKPGENPPPAASPEKPQDLPPAMDLLSGIFSFNFNGKPYRIETHGDKAKIIVNGKTWTIVGKRGKAAGKKITIDALEWTGEKLAMEVTGSGWIFAETKKSSLNASKVGEFLEHLATSQEPKMIKDEQGNDTGADLVRFLS